jgi:hypothetical protein
MTCLGNSGGNRFRFDLRFVDGAFLPRFRDRLRIERTKLKRIVLCNLEDVTSRLFISQLLTTSMSVLAGIFVLLIGDN